ncbi:hypothetical protein WM00_11840 [Burkholderia cepacia]|nr:hypothetical protein WM00_11840 [Burkholderia cepacia]
MLRPEGVLSHGLRSSSRVSFRGPLGQRQHRFAFFSEREIDIGAILLGLGFLVIGWDEIHLMVAQDFETRLIGRPLNDVMKVELIQK